MKPMLACSTIPKLNTIQYPTIASPKLDGIRCLIGEDHSAYTRNGKYVPNVYIQDYLSSLRLPRLDGELMIDGDFNAVQSGIMSMTGKPNFVYKVFDIVQDLPYHRRVTEYTKFVTQLNNPRITAVPTIKVDEEDYLVNLWNLAEADGYEGLITRKADGPYKQGRSTLKEGYMLKLKTFKESEAIIAGFEELRRNLDTSTKKQANMVGADMLGALIVTWNDEVFNIGSGFDEYTRRLVWQSKEQYLGKHVTFRYQATSKYNIPRFPTFKSFRSDL